jgi:DNA-binding response OmpR family regulator
MSLPKSISDRYQQVLRRTSLSSPGPKIIVFGERAEATQGLTQKLKEAGFDASALTQAANAKPSTLPGKPEIAIFLPRIERLSRTELARNLRKDYPRVKIVMLYEDKIAGAESADAVIHARTDFDDLVRTLHYLIDSNPSDPAKTA